MATPGWAIAMLIYAVASSAKEQSILHRRKRPCIRRGYTAFIFLNRIASDFGQGIGLCCNFQVGVFDVCINLRGIQVLVAEHLLHGSYIDTV